MAESGQRSIFSEPSHKIRERIGRNIHWLDTLEHEEWLDKHQAIERQLLRDIAILTVQNSLQDKGDTRCL